MYTKDVKNTLKNRRKIEESILSVTNIGITGLADYFEVPVPSIKKDLNSAGKDLSSYEANHSGQKTVEQLKRLRKNEIESRLKNEAAEDILESLGLWRMPSDVKISANKFKDFPADRAKLMKRASGMIEKGVGIVDASLYLGLTKVEREYLKNLNLTKSQVKVFNDEEETVVQNYVKDGETPENVSRLTGYSKTKLNFVEKGYDVGKKYTYNKSEKTEKQIEKEARMEEAYRRHLAGEREQTIADSYGVNRMTVGNWIRAKKLEHLNEREITGEGVYYRRRNTEYTEKHGSYDKEIERIPKEDVKKAEFAAKKALGMGMMHHFGYGAQTGTTNAMSIAEHAKLVQKQHLNKAVHKIDPSRMKHEVTFGNYEEYLEEMDLVKD